MADTDKKRAPLSETDLASDIMGRNELQGDDQANVRNERQAVPDAKQTADSDPVESAILTDKVARAKAELGKGNRHASPKGREEEKKK